MVVEKEESTGKKILGFVGAIIGFIIGKYSGVFFLIPAFFCVVIWFLTKKITTSKNKIVFIPAFSIQSAHLIWLSFAIFTPNGFAQVYLDLLFISIGLAWLMARPGISPVIYLCILQLLSVAVNGYSLFQAEISSAEHKALLIHLILRVVAIGALVSGYIQLKKNTAEITNSIDS